MRNWRKMTWVLYGWCALILAWVIAGTSSAQSANDCTSETTASLQKLCQDATDVGTGIGVLLILFVGFFGFMFFSAIWFMTRPRQVVVVSAPAQ